MTWFDEQAQQTRVVREIKRQRLLGVEQPKAMATYRNGPERAFTEIDQGVFS